MRTSLHKAGLVVLLFALIPLFGAAPPDYSRLISTGKRAIRSMESAQQRLVGIISPLVKMMNNGVESVSKEYWDKNVVPALILADKDLSPLPEHLISVLPTRFNPKSNDPKDEPWVSIYDLSYSIKYIDLKRQTEIFDSEYIMLLVGASNYVQMYITLLDARYENIERNKNRLQQIIDNPDGFRRSRVEVTEREEREKREKEEREEQELRNHALRRSPIKPDHSLDRYRSPFSYADVSLGLEFSETIQQLKIKGYKLEKQEVMKDTFYGFTPVAFLKGTFDGNPTRIRIKATPLSYRVFEITATVEKILDEYEADEVINKIASDFVLSHPNYSIEAQNGSQTLSFFQSVDGTGKIFNKSGIPSGGVILRDYSVRGDMNSYTGMISLGAISDMSQGYFIDYRLYDYKIGKVSQNEANL